MSEAAILADIRIALGARADCRVLRLNTGAFEVGDRLIRSAPKGTPDVLVLLAGGRYLWLEVKTATGRMRPAQAAFRAMVLKLGGLHEVVRSADDAVTAVEAAIRENR